MKPPSLTKRLAREALAAIGIYPSIKYSDAYDVYCAIFLRDHWREQRKRTERLAAMIGRDALVFDVGASEGSKADDYRRFSRQVVCVEPDRRSAEVLRNRFRRRPNVVVVEAAIGDREGTGQFLIEEDGSCFNTLSAKWARALEGEVGRRAGRRFEFRKSYDVKIVTLDHLVGRFGVPRYIKLDVEGYEVNALRGLSHPVPLISFEANLPAFVQETVECVQVLERLFPAVQLGYSLEEGIGETIFGPMSPAEFVDMVTGTRHEFMEVVAVMDLDAQGSADAMTRPAVRWQS